MCGCIARVNEHLAQFNTKIEVPLWSSSGNLSPFISTIKVDNKKRGKPRLLASTHCPFCGERYETKEKVACSSAQHNSGD